MSRRVHSTPYATPAGNLSRLQLVLRAGIERTDAPAPSKPANPETPDERSLKGVAREEILLRRVVAAFKDPPPKPAGREGLHPGCRACEGSDEGEGEEEARGKGEGEAPDKPSESKSCH